MFWKTLLYCVFAVLSFERAYTCTGILQKSEDNQWVYGRTMEFGADLVSFDLLFVPRGINYTSQTANGGPGAKWTTKYAHVGFNPFGMQTVADGLNEKGLACGAFYFPGWAEYEKVNSQEEASKTISNIDFVSWTLGNFSTVNEVREALKNTKVIGLVFKAWNIIPPLHYFIADQSGDRAVIEWVGGNLRIYEAPLGTITNAPSYEWHMINARNYIGLQALNKPSVKINGTELSQFGQGSGAIGLPGDFSPPSRFIRATFLNQVVFPGKDNSEQVNRTFKILNQFDIPKGAVREISQGKLNAEETQWTSVADLSGIRYYFHTALSRVIRSIDLNKLDLDSKKIKSIPVNTPESVKDLSSDFKENS